MSEEEIRKAYVVVDDDHDDDCVILNVSWKKPLGFDDDCVVLTAKPKKQVKGVKDSLTESDDDLLVLGDKGKVFFHTVFVNFYRLILSYRIIFF